MTLLPSNSRLYSGLSNHLYMPGQSWAFRRLSTMFISQGQRRTQENTRMMVGLPPVVGDEAAGRLSTCAVPGPRGYRREGEVRHMQQAKAC